MYINSITIHNLRSYKDTNILSFDRDNDLNIILGENGAGKTSILTSILFCLFGNKIVKSRYKKFVYDLFNYDAKDNKMYVEMDFNHNDDKIKVKRTITFIENDFVENELFVINDKKVENLLFLQNYNMQLIELFFFNGENILEIFTSNELKKLINTFISLSFGLDTAEIALKDIKGIVTKELDKLDDTKYSQLNKDISKLEKSILKMEKSIEELEFKKNDYNTKIKVLIQKLKDNNKLSSEEQSECYKSISILKDELKENRNKIDLYLNDAIFDDLLIKINNKTTRELKATFDERIHKISKMYIKGYEHNLSIDFNTEFIFKEKSKSKAYKNILKLINSESTIEKEINFYRKKLNETKRGSLSNNINDNIDKIVEDLNQLEDDIYNKYCKLSKYKDDYSSLMFAKHKIEETILNDQLKFNSINEKIKYQKALEEYISISKDNISKNISLEFIKTSNKIFRKKKFIDKVLIEEEVKFYYKNKEIKFDSLSSGERQVIILSLLFCIINLSNRELPLVMDSIISRLDSSHTKAIIDYLSKDLTNQVIIFNTDNEQNSINISLNRKIKPIYKLTNNTNISTTIKEVK